MLFFLLQNILDKFNPGARQMITAGKAYLKALHGKYLFIIPPFAKLNSVQIIIIELSLPTYVEVTLLSIYAN